MALKLILNEELPVDLRKALDSEAQNQDITLNDAASRVLADKFNVEWNPSGFAYRPLSAVRFKLRVSEDLHKEMRMEAAKNLFTIRGLALNALSTHYSTDIISPQRRPRREVDESD